MKIFSFTRHCYFVLKKIMKNLNQIISLSIFQSVHKLKRPELFSNLLEQEEVSLRICTDKIVVELEEPLSRFGLEFGVYFRWQVCVDDVQFGMGTFDCLRRAFDLHFL